MGGERERGRPEIGPSSLTGPVVSLLNGQTLSAQSPSRLVCSPVLFLLRLCGPTRRTRPEVPSEVQVRPRTAVRV